VLQQQKYVYETQQDTFFFCFNNVAAAEICVRDEWEKMTFYVSVSKLVSLDTRKYTTPHNSKN